MYHLQPESDFGFCYFSSWWTYGWWSD